MNQVEKCRRVGQEGTDEKHVVVALAGDCPGLRCPGAAVDVDGHLDEEAQHGASDAPPHDQ